MSLAPLFKSGPVIIAHALAALAALVLGALQLWGPKGTVTHRMMGRIWVALMAGVALSSLFIFEIRLIGPFSPIHLLSLYVLCSLVTSIRAARAGDIRRHKSTMKQMYVLGLIVTGAFTLFPGRLMHAVFFG